MEPEKGNEEVAGDAGQHETVNENIAAGVQSDGTPDGGENQDEKYKAAVTMANVEKDKRQAAEAELQNERDRIALLAVNQPQVQTEQKTLYKAVAEKLGIDLEYASPEEQGQIFEAMMQVTSGQQSEQSFINSHPDYAEVVGVQGPGGPNDFRPAPPLMRALKANPALANALQNSPNKAVLAYEIASKDPQYLAEQAEKAKPDDVKDGEKAQAKINAANKQLSISGAKGGGQLDQAAAISAMSDEEFAAHNQKIIDQAN